MKIYIASDHGGFELKQKIDRWLQKRDIEYEDLGNHILDSKDDYPDFANKLAKRVVREKTFGILLCGSAQGMCIAANKVQGVRAAIPFSIKEARLSREHNDANIICLSGWYTHFHKATKILEKFLTTPFSKAKRHIRRLSKIRLMER